MLSTASASANLEQSNADLALLTTSLSKSRRITDSMVFLLSNLDNRLAKLDKDLGPIHNETGRLTRVSENLERSLRSIDGLLGHQSLVAREQGLIDAGPDPDNFIPYQRAIDRLLSASSALTRTDSRSQGATLTALNALIKSATAQLVAVFTRWIKESSFPVDAGYLFDQGKPFPPLAPSFQDRGLSLYIYLRNLSVIGPGLARDAEMAYAEVRSNYMEDSVKKCSKEVLVDALGDVTAERRGLGRLLDVLIAMAQSEHSLLLSLFSSFSSVLRKEIYAAILPASLSTFFTTGTQLNTLIKQTLSSSVSIAFSSFAELTDRVPEFEEWIRAKASRKENELGELLHAYRGSCLRSLPEFIAETSAWGSKSVTNMTGTEATSARVTEMTVNVISFMTHLAENAETVESFLSVLGVGNWGDGANGGSAQRDALPVMEFGEGQALLSKYLNDVLSTLLTALDARSRTLRGKSGLATIYLLNNLSYIRSALLSSTTGDLLGEASEDRLNKRMRGLKISYLEIWSPLISSLLDAGSESSGLIAVVKGGGEKRETKDRFVRFGDAFEEIEALHRGARLEGDELKEKLREDVQRMVGPTYEKFLKKHRGGEFSKHASKYLKLDSEQWRLRTNALFE